MTTPFTLAAANAATVQVSFMAGSDFLACYASQSDYVRCHVLEVNTELGTITEGQTLLFDQEVGGGTGTPVQDPDTVADNVVVAGNGVDNALVCYIKDGTNDLSCNHVRQCRAWHGEKQLGKSATWKNGMQSGSIAMSSIDADRTWVCQADVSTGDTRCTVILFHSASAGDDPIFIGADGVPYEARAAWRGRCG